MQFCEITSTSQVNEHEQFQASMNNVFQLRRFNNFQRLIHQQNTQRMIYKCGLLQNQVIAKTYVNIQIEKKGKDKLYTKKLVEEKKQRISLNQKIDVAKNDSTIQKNRKTHYYYQEKECPIFSKDNKMKQLKKTMQIYDSAIQQNVEDPDYLEGQANTLDNVNKFEETLLNQKQSEQINLENKTNYNEYACKKNR